jgi:hypothetical protein
MWQNLLVEQGREFLMVQIKTGYQNFGGDNLTFSWSGPGITETTNLSTYFKTRVNDSGNLTRNF